MPKNSKGQGPAAKAPGSADDLERELASLQSQIRQKRTLLDRSRLNVAAIEKARGEGDHFLNDYFLSRRTADSTLVSELNEAASKAETTSPIHFISGTRRPSASKL